MVNFKKFINAVAFIGWLSPITLHAQNGETLPSVTEAAQTILNDALHLAELTDATKIQMGREITLKDTLKWARESEPKRQPSTGPWVYDFGSIGFQLSSALLCRKLYEMCLERAASEPGVCSCEPSSEGKFEFHFSLLNTLKE